MIRLGLLILILTYFYYIGAISYKSLEIFNTIENIKINN